MREHFQILYSYGGPSIFVNTSMNSADVLATGGGVILASQLANIGLVFKSVDGGRSWVSVSPLPTVSGSSDQVSMVYAAGEWISGGPTRVGRSSDNGGTWTQPTTPSAYETSNVAYGGGNLLAVSKSVPSAYATHSSDGGDTWTDVALGLLLGVGYPTGLAYNPVTGYFIGVQEGGVTAYRTSDLSTFTTLILPSAANWSAVAVNPSGVIMATSVFNRQTSEGVFPGIACRVAVSSDNGDTWTETLLGDNSDWTNLTWCDGVWVMTASGQASPHALVSKDDGATWAVKTTRLDVGTHGQVTFADTIVTTKSLEGVQVIPITYF